MRRFFIHQIQRTFVTPILLAVLLVLLGIVYLANPAILKPQNAQAGTSQNVSGFAWSGGADTPESGIGWISFNDTSDVPASPTYGVNVDTTTGNFSGTAWSEHIGWISFSRGVTRTPPQDDLVGSSAIAKVNWLDGSVTGWARALAGCEGTPASNVPSSRCASNSAGAAAGGWDGWISLSGVADDGGSYGVTITNDIFSGYAWGGDIIGWIQFSGTATDGSPYKVIVNSVAAPLPCTDTTRGTCNLTAVPSGSSSGSCVSGHTGSCNYLCDDAAWTEVSNFCMPVSPLSVSCTGSPLTALLGQDITWTATINFGGGTPPFSYSWGGTNIPTSPAPSTNNTNSYTNSYIRSYSTIGLKTAKVTVTDSVSPPITAICDPVNGVRINFNPDFEE